MEEKPEKHNEEDTQLETLQQDLIEEKKRSDECLTRLKYVQADFENLKKRYDRQLEETRKFGNERLIVELLDVVDELEMAVKSTCSSGSDKDVVQGVEMTLKKLEKILKKEEVSQIECLGKPFDPSRHDAIAKIEKDGAEDCTVVEEIRKGYTMKEKVIRPSMVKVAVKPSSNSEEEMNPDE